MQKRTIELEKYLKKQGNIVKFSDILKAGFHSDSLMSLIREKKVEKISRGFYKLIAYNISTYPDLVTASIQVPRGIICLLSALSFYEVTSEIPRYVNIAIQQGSRANRIKYPPLKFYRFAKKVWESGIEIHEIEGHKVRIYSLAKTIADCFKFRNKIGINIAREALKSAINEKKCNAKEIMNYAKICRVDRIMKPILETLI